MTKGLYCDTCNEGPFRKTNGLRGHRQFAHGVPPKPEGDRSRSAQSLDTRRLSDKLALLENVVAQMVISNFETYPIYCPHDCNENLEYVELKGETGFKCPTCHYTLSITG